MLVSGSRLHRLRCRTHNCGTTPSRRFVRTTNKQSSARDRNGVDPPRIRVKVLHVVLGAIQGQQGPLGSSAPFALRIHPRQDNRAPRSMLLHSCGELYIDFHEQGNRLCMLWRGVSEVAAHCTNLESGPLVETSAARMSGAEAAAQ